VKPIAPKRQNLGPHAASSACRPATQANLKELGYGG